MNPSKVPESPSPLKGGRPIRSRGIRALAAQHVRAAISTLATVVNDNAAPHADRVHAAEVLLIHAAVRPAEEKL